MPPYVSAPILYGHGIQPSPRHQGVRRAWRTNRAVRVNCSARDAEYVPARQRCCACTLHPFCLSGSQSLVNRRRPLADRAASSINVRLPRRTGWTTSTRVNFNSKSQGASAAMDYSMEERVGGDCYCVPNRTTLVALVSRPLVNNLL